MSTKLNPKEQQVLEFLQARTAKEGEMCSHFDPIVKSTGLTRPEVRRACRSLRRKGLAEYYRGLWNDDEPAGAGYCVSEAGEELEGGGENER